MDETEGLHERLSLVVVWIKHADSKAVAVLSGAAAVSGVAASQLDGAGSLSAVALIVSIAASLVAGYHAWSALIPRLKASEPNPDSTIFFAAIADTESSAVLAERLRHRTPDIDLADYSHQLRELSRIAQEKFRHVDVSITNVAGAALVLAVGLALKAGS